MALTINGNRTGAAGATVLREQRAYIAEVNDPNSDEWWGRFVAAWDELQHYPLLRDIWNSDLVPEHATHRKFALIAEMLLRHKNVVPESDPIEGAALKRHITHYASNHNVNP